MKLSRWARATLLTGAIILAIGVIPVWLSATFLPAGAPALFAIAFYMLAPLGIAILVFSIVLWLISWIKK